jgi:hypothetical protein
MGHSVCSADSLVQQGYEAALQLLRALILSKCTARYGMRVWELTQACEISRHV